MNTGLPGYCNKGISVPRVLCQSYRSHRSSGQGYGDLTELTDVPGTGTEVSQKSQKLRAGIKMLYPYPGYLWHWCTELTEVPGTGTKVVQNLDKFRVRV